MTGLAIYTSETEMLQAIADTAAERDRFREISAELLEALKQVRTDYHKVHTAYEEAVIDLGGNTILSKEIARVVLDRIDAAIAKAQEGAA